MSFIPQLPTFDVPVTLWKFNPGPEIYSLLGEFLGQVYFPHRGQPGTDFGAYYLMLPKEDDVLTDWSQYERENWDLLRFRWPTATGTFKYYKILRVDARWLGFPNEYIAAELMQLTPTELAAMVGPEVDEWSWDGDLLLSLSEIGAGTCGTCDALVGDRILTRISPPDPIWESVPAFAFACLGGAGCYFLATVAGTVLFVELYDAGDVLHAQWSADFATWNGFSPLVCTLGGTPTGECDWPTTITVSLD